jgi:hypothetical protein
MDPQQISLSPRVEPQAQIEAVAPSQVWMQLTQAQQHWVLHTMVLVCQEFLPPSAPTLAKDVRHDQPA